MINRVNIHFVELSAAKEVTINCEVGNASPGTDEACPRFSCF